MGRFYFERGIGDRVLGAVCNCGCAVITASPTTPDMVGATALLVCRGKPTSRIDPIECKEACEACIQDAEPYVAAHTKALADAGMVVVPRVPLPSMMAEGADAVHARDLVHPGFSLRQHAMELYEDLPSWVYGHGDHESIPKALCAELVWRAMITAATSADREAVNED